MELEFVKRELNLTALSGEKLDDSIQELIDQLNKSLSYKVVEPFINIWYNHLDLEVLKIDNKDNCVIVHLSNMNLSLGFNSDIYRILLEYILEKDFSEKDFRFIIGVRIETSFDVK